MTTIMTYTDRDFSMMHLAMISKNGTIWDISLNEKTSPSKKYLFKLPKSCWYHGYSDDKGVLYFIDGYLRKVIQFHLSLSKLGHKEVANLKGYDSRRLLISNYNSYFADAMCHTKSLRFGNVFWIFYFYDFFGSSHFFDP